MSENKKEVDTSFPDRMKEYEDAFTSKALDVDLPICFRMDGKGFSKFTKSLTRPFDERLSKVMIDTMNFLVEETGASVGYTQSDEISLVFLKNQETSDIEFNGKIQKLVSTIAAKTSVRFNRLLGQAIPEKVEDEPVFDARAWNVPTQDIALETIVWRMRDARKNSISMACHAHIDHRKTLGKSSSTRLEMLQEIGVEWASYPEFFKTGTLAVKTLKKYDKIPAEFAKYHQNNEDGFYRTEIHNFNFPALMSNHADVKEQLLEKVFSYKNMSAQIRKAKKRV